MKAIVCGGRNNSMTNVDFAWLAKQLSCYGIHEIVTGGAYGIDMDAANWAIANEFPLKTFPANWEAYGRAAGPQRNRQMAEYIAPDGIVIAFPGGKGTASMIGIALEMGLQVQYRA